MKTVEVKYFNTDIKEIKNIEMKSDWYDLRASEDISLKKGDLIEFHRTV